MCVLYVGSRFEEFVVDWNARGTDRREDKDDKGWSLIGANQAQSKSTDSFREEATVRICSWFQDSRGVPIEETTPQGREEGARSR